MNELKPGWKMVKFGEVVKNANLVERDPETNGIERIVGLEHIDPENLHIRRWNSVADGTSFTRKFVPGQTLFGKRRAYQRKVAYAEFEGICSGDILTFEPKNRKVLLPELLPFICQSDAFFDHALDTSAGSLSPRTSWTALKDFEFSLPPLDEQKRIAEILWAADGAYMNWFDVLSALKTAEEKWRRDILTNKSQLTSGSPVRKLGDVADITMGQSPKGDSYNTEKRGMPLLNGPTEFGEMFPTATQYTDSVTKLCQPGDILFCVRGSTTGRQNWADKEYCIGRGLATIRGKSDVSSVKYLKIVLEALSDDIYREAKGSGSTFPNITSARLSAQKFPVPSIEAQEKAAEIFDCFRQSENDAVTHLETIKQLSKRLMMELGGATHV